MESEIVFVNTDFLNPEKVVALRKMLETMNPELTIFEHSTGSEEHEFSDFVDFLIRSDA